MNTEITDTKNTEQRNWVCYDADCALCVRWAGRFRRLLARHGFKLMPLQSSDARAALPLRENELLTEMRVITPNGSVLGGADALVYLSRVVCKPLFILTHVPGAKSLLRSAYRFLARHRSCAAGNCSNRGVTRSQVGNPADWLPLLVLPPTAAVIGRQFPPWLYMWALAFALFVGCKWLCFRKGGR